MSPLHTQIEQYLFNQIKTGQKKPGDQIETENELMELFGASRPTVRQALNRLTDSGYLVRIKGKGSFVTEPKMLHESTTFLSSYRQEVAHQNRTLLTQVLQFSTIQADEKLSGLLQLKKKASVARLTRLRRIPGYHNNRPVVYTTVSIPLSRFPEMMSYDFSSVSLYDTLEANNRKVARARRNLEVILPPAQIAEALEISVFEPVIFVTSCGFLEDNTPIEYSESCYPASISKFLIEVER